MEPASKASKKAEPGSEKVEPGSEKVEPGSEKVEPGSEKVEPESKKVEPVEENTGRSWKSEEGCSSGESDPFEMKGTSFSRARIGIR